MEKIKIESDKILNLVASLAPLGVIVTTQFEEDRYYIHFDGRNTYKDTNKWDKLWGSFDGFINNVLTQHDIKVKTKELQDEYCAQCFIGTLFDILSSNNE